jgi:hypothetical protein
MGHCEFLRLPGLLLSTIITKLASQQSYAHYEPMAATLPAKFLVEALRIYDAEKGVDSLTTVAATSLMSMTWITLGNDKAGRRLQEDSARMAQRMRLYGESDVSSYNQLDLSDECVEAAVCATAWGSFKLQIYSAVWIVPCENVADRVTRVM